MTSRELDEYRALRDTIRERGTARIWLFMAGLTAWAGLTVATATLAALPVSTLLPLLVLEGAFEAIFALHTGVERVGRYVQVFFEEGEGGEPSECRWEHQAMAYGARFPGGGIDPLFAGVYWMAAVVNFIPAVLADPAPIEWMVVGAVHVLFMARVAVARRYAARQRATDLERFRQLKAKP